MNTFVKKPQPIKLVFIVLLSVLIFSSCKSDNLCSLTFNQSPEIRGFRLGMTREQVEQKVPRSICSNFGNISLKSSKTFSENQLFEPKEIEEIYKLKARESDKFDEFKYFYCEFDDVSILDEGSIGTTPRNVKYKETNFESYPQLKDIIRIEFVFRDDILSRIRIDYDSFSDRNFDFDKSVMENLGLSEWTNWVEMKPALSEQEIEDTTITKKYQISANQLQCNKLIFKTIKKTIDKKYFHLFPSVVIAESANVAVTESQKEEIQKQEKLSKEKEIKDKEENWKNEQKQKSETFKP